MPQKKLTAAAIPHLPEDEWWDAILPGLILRVGKKRRSWSVRFHAEGSYQRVSLGHWPAMELGEARDAARAVIERADMGMPLKEPVPHPRSANVLTLGGLLDRYEQLRIREGDASRCCRRRCGTCGDISSHASACLPRNSPSRTCARSAMNCSKPARVSASNRLLADLGPALKWAAEEDLIPVNFVPSIRRTAEPTRERVLSKEEIKAVWIAAGKLDHTEVAATYGRLVVFAARRATTRRGGLASPRSYPQRRLAADREQGRVGRTTSRCRRWRWHWSGMARRGTTCLQARSARSARSPR